MKLKKSLKNKLKNIKIIDIVVTNVKSIVYESTLKIELIFMKIYCKISNKNNSGNLKKVLIVKPDAIGDFIIFSKYIEAYVDLYRRYKIDLLINKVNYELAKDCENIDEIITIDKRATKKCDKFKLVKYIREKNYSKVIYPINSRDVTGDKICIFSNAKQIITFSGDNCNMPSNIKKINNKYFSEVIKTSSNLEHEKTHNEEFLMKLGYKKNEFKTFLKLKEENFKFFNIYIRDNEEYIVLVPGCQSLIRFWSEEKYAEIIEYICNIKKLKVVVLGSKSEIDLISSILNRVNINDEDLLINLVGKTDLHNMITIISRASLYIGSETSAVHIAELYDTESICIIGGGHYKRFYPYPSSKLNHPVTMNKACFNCNWECIYDEAKCIKEVKVKDVKRIIDKII